MAIHFRCPNGHTLSAEEHEVGYAVRCEECFKKVRVPAPHGVSDAVTATAPIRPRKSPQLDEDHDEDMEERARRPRHAPHRSVGVHPYHRIRIGLSLHYTWILIYLISIALGLLVMVAGSDPRS